MASLQGRHGVVTGGGRGIGRAIAAALTQAGAAVTIAGRGETALAEVAANGEAAGYVIADVPAVSAVNNGVEQAAAAPRPAPPLFPTAPTPTAPPSPTPAPPHAP